MIDVRAQHVVCQRALLLATGGVMDIQSTMLVDLYGTCREGVNITYIIVSMR